jgi:L-ascorbate metabolism protein UlaG (beta-lactamase superfamily)
MVTMDGRQGARALRLIRPARAVPIHYDDYTAFKSPLSDFQREVRAAGLESTVTYLGRGDVLPLEGLDG